MLETRSLPDEPERDDLFRQWQALRSGLQAFAGAERSGIALTDDEYRGFQQALAGDVPRPELLRLVERWADDPVLPRLDRLAEHATRLASRLGKCKLTVDLGATNLRLPHEPWNRVWPCLGHVVRNAVDHGLETEAERVSAGKPAAARLTLTAHETGDAVVIVVADDGRGVDWDGLRRKAASLALPSATRDDLVAAMFADGVTTREAATYTSGRGVGLAAVRQLVESLGGAISVDSEPGRGTRFGFSFSTARARDGLRRAS
jgi:two-component system chemotaxis sensor kinase CheA